MQIAFNWSLVGPVGLGGVTVAWGAAVGLGVESALLAAIA
jgi:hypothetical protein